VTRPDKLTVLALVGLLAVTSVVAIATDRTDPPTDPAFGGTYVEGVVGAPLYFDPIIAATSVDQDVSRLVFTGLTRFDRDGTIVADLAAAFEVDTSGRVWTFTIRRDANWQDGAPVTADDVLYTVGLLQDKAYHGAFADAFRGVTVAALGPKIVRFTLPDAYAPFAGSTTVPLLPSHLLSQVTFAGLARQPFNARPIGTGPFKVSEVDARRSRSCDPTTSTGPSRRDRAPISTRSCCASIATAPKRSRPSPVARSTRRVASPRRTPGAPGR
jgi:peptide/nickel transport system substrate-binding protein